jgi:RND superfamily putative drug exporter
LKLSTESLAVASSRHPWSILAFWGLAVVVSLWVSANLFASAVSTEDRFLNEPESQIAADLLQERLRGPLRVTEMLIVRSDELTVDDPAFEEQVSGLTLSVVGLGSEIVQIAVNYYMLGDESMVSSDRHTTIIPVVMAGDVNQVVGNIDTVREAVQPTAAGFETFVVGLGSVNRDFAVLSEEDLKTGETIGIGVALVILVLVFRAVGAAGIPLLLAIVSIVVAVALASLAGQAYQLSFFIVNMITMIGLAVGIDYSLFIVGRYREERAAGLEKMEAIAKAGSTSGRAVFFSGMAVVLALSGMLMVPSSVFYSLGMGAVLVALVAVVAALTLLPAVLSLLGDWVEAWSLPFLGGSGAGGGRFWTRITKLVMARPVVSLVLAGGLLLLAASPGLSLNQGSSGISSFPDEAKTKRGFEILQAEFSAGLASPAEIVVDGPVDSIAVQAGIERLVDSLRIDPIYGNVSVETNSAGDLTLISVPINADQFSNDGIGAARRIRDEMIPAAEIPAAVYLGGRTAKQMDFTDIAQTWMPRVFAFVLSLSFILLTVAFRSLVVPLKAILMNLLSVAAAYGLLVLVFQLGVGADLLGFTQTDTIESWLPLFLFSILFGLSMDYHVILLSRIRERYDQTGDNEESVAHGLRTTAGMITGAALIMVAVFGGFATGRLVMLQQMGFGLAVAIFLDATIVRSILIPASMKLLGDKNWWFPSFLEWLPDLRVEPVETKAAEESPAATTA